MTSVFTKMISVAKYLGFFFQSRTYHILCAIVLLVMLWLPVTGPESLITFDFGVDEKFGCARRFPGYHSVVMMFQQGDWDRYFLDSSSAKPVWGKKPCGPLVGLLVIGLWTLVLASPCICHVNFSKKLLYFAFIALLTYFFWLLSEWHEDHVSYVFLAPGEYLLIIPVACSIFGYLFSFVFRKYRTTCLEDAMCFWKTLPTVFFHNSSKFLSWLAIAYIQLPFWILNASFFLLCREGIKWLRLCCVISSIALLNYALYQKRNLLIIRTLSLFLKKKLQNYRHRIGAITIWLLRMHLRCALLFVLLLAILAIFPSNIEDYIIEIVWLIWKKTVLTTTSFIGILLWISRHPDQIKFFF